MGIGMKELLVILAIALLVFGAKKLKTIGTDLGGAVRGFKKAMSDGEEEEKKKEENMKQIRSDAPDAEFADAAKTDASTAKKEDSKV
jgi:sec-independent protein translocase protein TatA